MYVRQCDPYPDIFEVDVGFTIGNTLGDNIGLLYISVDELHGAHIGTFGKTFGDKL